MDITIEKLDYHRNGISGQGFFVVFFNDPENGPMLGIVFPEPGYVAVLQRELLTRNVIEFSQNSWRGDAYEPELRRAITEWNNES